MQGTGHDDVIALRTALIEATRLIVEGTPVGCATCGSVRMGIVTAVAPFYTFHVGMHTLYLVRHGHYNELDGGGLTDLGREQAELVGKALAGHTISRIYTSTLRRALETTNVVSRSFPHVRIQKMRLLCEAVPTKIPRFPNFAPLSQIKADRARADAAFNKLFRPVRQSRSDLVIAHGNIIRYFVSKALGIPPMTWLKLGSTHCSITEIVIEQSGYMRLHAFNETQHLPQPMRTLSIAAMKQDG